MATEKVPLNLYKRVTTPLSRLGSSIYTTPANVASIVLNTFTNNNTNNNRYVTLSLSSVSQGNISFLNRFKLDSRDVINITPEKVVLQEGDSILATGDIEDITSLNDPALFWEFNLPTELTPLTGVILNTTSPAQPIIDWGVTTFRNTVTNEDFLDWNNTLITRPISGIVVSAADGAVNWAIGTQIQNNNATGTATVSREVSTPEDQAIINTPYFARLTNNISSLGTTNLSQLTSTTSFGHMAITSNLHNNLITTPEQFIQYLLGKEATVTFWARASQPTKIFSETQIYRLGGPVANRFWTPTQHKIFDLTTNWQQFTHTYTHPTFEQVRSSAYNPLSVDVNNPSYPPLCALDALPDVTTWRSQIDIKTFWSLGLMIQSGNSPARPAGYPGQAMTVAELSSITESIITNGYYDIAAVRYTLTDPVSTFTTNLSSGVQTVSFVYDPTLETDTNVTLSILETDNRQ